MVQIEKHYYKISHSYGIFIMKYWFMVQQKKGKNYEYNSKW